MTRLRIKGRVRTNDYATSIKGAMSVSYRAGSQKQRLLEAYRAAGDHGLTDDEAALACGLEKSCFWKRCGELRQDGAIVDTGRTRPGPMFGEQRMVSVAVR